MTDLLELTTTDTANLPDKLALIPTGSTEQHGPALPLGTDTIVARSLAESVGEHPSVVVAPTIPIGVSPHHRHFSGTLWVSDSTFRRYVEEVARSLASHGLNRMIFVNGHGGNVGALQRVGQRLRGEGVAYAVCWNWWVATDELLDALFDTEGGHAGHGETSMMYAVDHAQVRDERLEEAEDGIPPGWGKQIHGAEVGFDTIDFTPTGAVGKPTEATEAAGEQIRAEAVTELEALVDWMLSRSEDDLFEHARPLHKDD